MIVPVIRCNSLPFTIINGLSDYGSGFLTQYFERFSIAIDSQHTHDLKKITDCAATGTIHRKMFHIIFLVKTGENVYTLNVGNDDVK